MKAIDYRTVRCSRRKAYERWFGVLTALAIIFDVQQCIRPLLAQTLTQVTATNPKYPEFYDPPFQSQLKSLVQGAKAQTLPDSRILISDAKIQSFETNGQTELLIEAPQCTYERAAHAVSSPGTLHVQTGDGKFMIDGTGFLWLQTNSVLFISNRVHTFVQADLLQAKTAKVSEPGSVPKLGDLEIASQSFIFDRTNGIASYLGEAKITGTNLSIQGGSIVIVVPMLDRRLQSITIETNVVMDYEKVHVDGERAVYGADSGLARVTGQPKWRSEEREGSADELVIDPTNKVFRANGQAYLKFPAVTAAGTSFLPAQLVPGTNAAPVTNRIVEISSDYYEFHTNSASFGDHVLLTELANAQPHGTLTCGSLNVAFAGTNELQSMTARTNVVVQQETNRLAAELAVYSAATGNLELTGNPSWQSGLRQGKGDLIVINPHQEEMLVRGDASLRLPAKELGNAGTLAPDRPADSAGPEKTIEFADVFAEEYTFKPDSGRFDRHVRIIHPRMNWSCDRLGVDSAAAGGKSVTILAEGSVVFVCGGENQSPVHGTCERAEYLYNRTVEPIVDRMELTGHPILETTNATVRNAIIILDQAQHRLFLPGQYALSGTANALGTNAFRPLPK